MIFGEKLRVESFRVKCSDRYPLFVIRISVWNEDLIEILRFATIDLWWRVRPSIRPDSRDYSGTGRCTSSKFPVPNFHIHNGLGSKCQII